MKPQKVTLYIHWKTVLVIVSVLLMGAILLNIPAVNTMLHVPYCRARYARNADILAEHLPDILAEKPNEWHPLFPMEAAAWRIESEGATAVCIKMADYGDFYRHTYQYGLLWTEDAPALLRHNPDLSLTELENGWFVYALIKPQ